MAIRYVTGTLGHGKSLYGARAIGKALNSGRVVASNMRLLDGWQEQVLRHNPFYRVGGQKYKREAVREISTRYWYERDFRKLLGARIRGYGEGRGLRLFDEAHLALNNREWDKDDQKLMLKRLSLSRKRGWEDLIISQHKKNTDMAIRRIAFSEIQVVNLQKTILVPVIGAKLLPCRLFYAQEFKLEESNMGGEKLGKRIKWEIYPLGWWRDIYDTNEDYEFADDLDDAGVLLPLPAPPLQLSPSEGAHPGETPQVAAGGADGVVLLSEHKTKMLGGASSVEDTPPDRAV